MGMRDANTQWRNMDPKTRADAYSPSTALPDGDLMPFLRTYAEKSAAAYAAFPETRTLLYGAGPANTVDIIVPKSKTSVPLHVFIHGGYWQELSKRESFLAAPDTVAQGIAFAAVDYTLAPKASLDAIVAECVAALSMLVKRSDKLGIDRTRIVVSGSSAGAHLAAMSCLNLAENMRPKALVLMSGIFELEPLIGTYINDAIGMDLAEAKRNSPAFGDLSTFPQTLIAWGEHETAEFKLQSQHFAKLLKAAGRDVETLEMAGRNHFDIIEDIANTTKLGRILAALALDEAGQSR
jgi:arylformamidase